MKITRTNLLIAVISFLLILAVSTLYWYFLSADHSAVCWNDHLFVGSVILFCAGSIMAVVSKSRRHYYMHLKDKFSGKKDSDHEFDEEEARRNRQAGYALSIAAGGVGGIIVCAAAVYFM